MPPPQDFLPESFSPILAYFALGNKVGAACFSHLPGKVKEWKLLLSLVWGNRVPERLGAQVKIPQQTGDIPCERPQGQDHCVIHMPSGM